MVVTLGWLADGSMTGETWILDLNTHRWRCHFGSGAACSFPTPLQPQGPSERAFASAQRVGMNLFIFGGATLGNQGGVRGQGTLIGLGDMWALNLATLAWAPVDQGSAASSPQPRAFASMVSLDRQAGLKSPVVVIGGADLDCYSRGRCAYPRPLDDVWIRDVAAAENDAVDDNHAEFDGNDFIAVDLPAWCRDVGSMSVLWIDAWVYTAGYTTAEQSPIVIFDTYYGDSSVLRWCFEGSSVSSGGEITSYVTLFLTTSQVP